MSRDISPGCPEGSHPLGHQLIKERKDSQAAQPLIVDAPGVTRSHRLAALVHKNGARRVGGRHSEAGYYRFWPGARADGLPVVSRQFDAPDVPMCGPGLPPSGVPPWASCSAT